MDMNKTLASVFTQNTQQNQSQEGSQNQSVGVYLTIFSLNLTHRFPDITDLNSIDYTTVRRIAEFSAACSSVATEVWDELGSTQNRQRLIRKSA